MVHHAIDVVRVGRKPKAENEMEMARLLAEEIDSDLFTWLLSRDVDVGTKAAQALLKDYQEMFRAKSHDPVARQTEEVQWVLSRVLSAGPGNALSARDVRELRHRLLARGRDRRRRQGPVALSVRVDAETFCTADRLVEEWSLRSKSDLLEVLIERALTDLISNTPGNPSGAEPDG